MENSVKILVEWADTSGRQQTGVKNTIGDGTRAIKTAMDTIQEVAGQVSQTIHSLAGNPQQRSLKTIEVEFGIKLDSEAGAFIAKAGIEASVVVKMIWERPEHEPQ